MSVDAVSPQHSSALDALVRQIISQADTNKDGQLSTEEFGAFLMKLLQGLGAASPDGAQKAGEAGAESDAGAPPPDESSTTDAIPPSAWTDDNAPYGVTLAGWDPQNHTNLTMDDLKDLKNAKYAVYEYLRAHRVEPDSTWAPAAADALNKQLGTTVFTALDGETLAYGDEYVHSAPNGYGMRSGTYNPNARGEFFWGYV